jgi:transposase
MVEVALGNMGKEFQAMYARGGRPSIPPEKLLRALLLQICTSPRLGK